MNRYNRFRACTIKCNFPFPHVFSLSPFPLCTTFEGTHGDRVAGDNTDAIDFVAIASSLRATNG